MCVRAVALEIGLGLKTSLETNFKGLCLGLGGIFTLSRLVLFFFIFFNFMKQSCLLKMVQNSLKKQEHFKENSVKIPLLKRDF